MVLVQLVQIPAYQQWFWSEEWQEGEREAEEQMQNGQVSEKMNADEIMAHLDSLMEQ
jgi:hypothetical protein